MEGIKSKVILITGGGSGMGEAISKLMGSLGAKVVVGDINAENGKNVVAEIIKAGNTAEFVQVDISNESQVKAMVETIVKKFGCLDIAINNAGVESQFGETLEQIDEESFDKVFSVNVKGTWLCLKHEIIQMRKQKAGVIVNLASVLGLVGCTHFSSYVATKHAIVGLTKCAALENATEGIRINACCPAAVQTPMLDRASGIDWNTTTPMQRVGTVDEVAKAVLWLASSQSSFTTGQCLVLDGGLSAG